MANLSDLVKNGLNGKGFISQRFMQFKSIYITKKAGKGIINVGGVLAGALLSGASYLTGTGQ